MSKLKVLLTGASGYIGGSVLTDLLQLSNDIDLTAVVRSDDHATAVKYHANDTPITVFKFQGLDDVVTLRQLGSEFDVVVSAASSMHKASGEALIEGLGERQKRTGKDVYFIHTSGTSNFGDHPFSGKVNTVVYHDTDDIHAWEKTHASGWINREVDVAIIDAGEKHKVQTVIINPPIIFGEGTGPVHKASIQLPILSKLAMRFKAAVQIGDGSGLWSVVHISDVSKFYNLVLRRILTVENLTALKQEYDFPRVDLPTGKQGYYFLDTGEVSWGRISQAIANSGVSESLFSSSQVKSLSAAEFSHVLGIPFLTANAVEVIWGSNARVRGIQSRMIGWEPVYGVEDFFGSIRFELRSAALEDH